VKQIPSGLLAHYQQGTTTIAACWKLTRQDGQVFGFTEHDNDLVIDGITYLAKTGFTPTAVQTQSKLAVDNLNANGILDSVIIQEQDLASGKWDYAEIEIFLVNYEDLSQGRDILVTGRIGEVTVGDSTFRAEVRGLANAYSQANFLIYQPGCRANFGDSKCGVDLGPLTVSGTIESVSNDGLTLTDAGRTEANGYFDYGKLTMTSGNSEGLSMEVKVYTTGTIVLQLQLAQGVEPGDTYDLTPGCGKRFNEDCVGRWNNGINFRGEPHLPGIDKILLFGGQR
jgi:uncharacterized phage protein (TIGR02218 family)